MIWTSHFVPNRKDASAEKRSLAKSRDASFGYAAAEIMAALSVERLLEGK